MHIYFPDSDIHKAQSVLFIYGGGWNDAIRNNTEWNGGWMANNARYFAERGFVSIAISYDILQQCLAYLKMMN